MTGFSHAEFSLSLSVSLKAECLLFLLNQSHFVLGIPVCSSQGFRKALLLLLHRRHQLHQGALTGQPLKFTILMTYFFYTATYNSWPGKKNEKQFTSTHFVCPCAQRVQKPTVLDTESGMLIISVVVDYKHQTETLILEQLCHQF